MIGPTARWCPMSPHFLTRRISRLLDWLRYPGLPPVLVSIAFSPFAFHGISRRFSFTLNSGVEGVSPVQGEAIRLLNTYPISCSMHAIGIHSCIFFTTDVSAPIRSIIHLLMVSFQVWDCL